MNRLNTHPNANSRATRPAKCRLSPFPSLLLVIAATMIAAERAQAVPMFDGFQSATSDGISTTWQIKIVGTPGENFLIRWEQPPGTLVAVINGIIPIGGTATPTFPAPAATLGPDRLVLLTPPNTTVDTCNANWGECQSAQGICYVRAPADPPICSNGIWEAGEECDGEDAAACPGLCQADCTCPAECGDGACQPSEDCDTCPEDCGPCGVCGDGNCGPGEDCENCEQDCGPCPVCGDEICEEGEDCETCPEDCPCEEGEVCVDGECVNIIPTVSEWGLIIMALLALTAGTLIFARRRRPAVA